MRFGVLGPLAVWTPEGEPVPVPGLKVRALLAVLLVNDGRPVSADRLIEDLWQDDPPRRNPPGALSAKVSQLRRALDEGRPGARALVVSRPPGYQLRLDDDALDAHRFQTLTARARETRDPAARAALLADALALWRGPAFADFGDEPFTQAAIARLEEQRLTAIEDAAEARLALGEHTALVGELGELLAVHPLRERLRAAHMRALYGAGRQSEALDSYEELRVHLAEELGLDPGPELAALQRAILAQELDPPAAPAPRPRTNLPAALAGLVGRDEAVAEVTALLETERLVTLTGPGGVGKTSLALETARRLGDGFTDGAWLVELAGAGTATLTDTVMSALDIRESDTADLVTALSSRSLLLVLDNCEHVIDRVAGLAESLLRGAPGLRILATSREPLALSGEVVWNVPPLEVPARDADLAALERSGAVRLFVERAAAAARGFTLDAATAPAVALVCRRLDGIPLALELAATRVRALGVQGVAERLDDRFRLLATGHRGAPPRQQTLMAMIDWSWELLTGPERTVLRRLAVHADGCTLEAAEAVGGDDGLDTLDLLVRLVDRSLVTVVPAADGPRYRLLESVAAYCAERIREADEEDALRHRHLRHYLALAERAEPLLYGPEQRRWLGRLDAEAGNLHAAFGYAVAERAADEALRLAGALAWYRYLRGRLTEARRCLDAALALGGGEPRLTARAAAWRAGLALIQGDAVHRGVDLTPLDEAARARAEWFLAFAALGRGEPAGTEEPAKRALAAFRAARDRWGEAAARMMLAQLAHVRGDLAALEREAGRSAELFAELGDRWGRLNATEWLAALAEITGDLTRAARLHHDGLRLAEELGLWPQVSSRLCWLGWTATQRGDHRLAREHGARALALAEEQSSDPGQVFATLVLAFATRRDGDLDAAEVHLNDLLARSGGPDEAPPVYVSMVLTELGFIAELRGRPDDAGVLHLEAFAEADRIDAPRDKAGILEGLAGALARAGRPADAAAVLGAASAHRSSWSMPAAPGEQGDRDRIATACRAALGEAAFTAACERGGRLTPEEAVALARAHLPGPRRTAHPRAAALP